MKKANLKVYNTLSREKEKFVPVHPGRVGIYVCGPTVYYHSHLGHAKSYITFDVVVRYLRWLGYKVKYVQNITDVGHLLDTGEDRILTEATKEKLDPMEIAEKYTRSYFEDMDALNVKRPNISPHATGHIMEQIELTKILLDKGYAYESEGSVYFDISKFSNYGKLSRRKLEDQLPGARIEVKSEKKHPADFALWIKAPKEHLMKWKSPWGIGYPGWHIECSTMSMKYLGETLDIHGGGMENAFPHHECEIAQSEAATGKQFVKYWMHHNMVLVNGVKMSKSLGNFVTIKDALKKYSGEQIRFFVLTTHYRSPLDFSDKVLKGAGEGIKGIHITFKRVTELAQTAKNGKLDSKMNKVFETYKQKFIKAMDDDFNTPVAISVLFDFGREVNNYLDKNIQVSKQTLQTIYNFYSPFAGDILGILPFSKQPIIEGTPFIEFLIELRSKLRSLKQWDLADEIRLKLKNLGIILEDKTNKTNWRIG
ncbi:cysteine--tRNA ligase [candidate division WOR-3 bacterium]|nr:cysteine--tRNA ligase [candidate division WOR-3 bacterium]